jgi:uncharacterized membrane protein YdjX (TVP38/TMEM64 family)
MRKALVVLFLVCFVALVLGLTLDTPLKTLFGSAIVWFTHQGSLGAILFGIVYALATVLLFPGTPLTLAGGYLYGTLEGSLVVSVASTTAATIAFLLGRYTARDWVKGRLARYPALSATDTNLAESGFKMVLLMRLQPVFVPFAYLNMGLGVSQVKLRDYVLGSWLGMLPGTILYVYVGSLLPASSLVHFDPARMSTHTAGQYHTYAMAAGFLCFLALFALISKAARKSFQRIQSAQAEPHTSMPEL